MLTLLARARTWKPTLPWHLTGTECVASLTVVAGVGWLTYLSIVGPTR